MSDPKVQEFINLNMDLLRQKRALCAALERIAGLPLGSEAEDARMIARNALRGVGDA
jgi:hypothetical protein